MRIALCIVLLLLQKGENVESMNYMGVENSATINTGASVMVLWTEHITHYSIILATKLENEVLMLLLAPESRTC